MSGALLGRLDVSVSMSFLRCKLFRTPPPRVAPKTYRTVAGPPSPRPSDKKRKKKARENENNQYIDLRGKAGCGCQTKVLSWGVNARG